MDVFSLSYLAVVAIICIITDYRYQRIPNAITYPSMLVGLIFHFSTNGYSGLYNSALGLLIGISLLLIPYLMGGLGAGDVKMLGAMGAIVGPQGVILILFYAAIIGGLYAIFLLLKNQDYRKQFFIKHFSMIKMFFLTRQVFSDELSIVNDGPKLCYGIAIAIGAYVYISEAFFGFTLLSTSLFA
jgi:prepilin peptidase CpaA